MNTMRGYFLFFSFMISMVLWDAMNKTLGATDIADAHSASAAGYWIVAILITIVFVVGLIAMKRSGATPKTEPPNQANGILLFSLMIYALAEQNHITTAIKQFSASQISHDAKLWFVAITTVNLLAWGLWTAYAYRMWRNGRKRSVNAA